MAVVEVNGVALYAETAGDGAPILGIHGTPSSALMWQEAAHKLATVGRCTIYDRRGFLRSAMPGRDDVLDLADHVEDAAALIRALSGEASIVIGRSTGGLIAVELARRYPESVKALVLLEPAVFSLDAQAQDWARQLRHAIMRVPAQDASQTVIREALGDNAWDSLPAEIADMFTRVSPAVLAEIRGRGLDLSEQPLELSNAELSSIAVPVLIVTAQDSPAPLHRVNDILAQHLPYAETLRVSGGHFIDPADEAVLEFVRRASAR